MKTRLTALASFAVAASLVLTGCSTQQSMDDACESAANDLTVLSKTLRGIMQTAPQKPDRAASALTDLAETFTEQTADITQTEIADTMSGVHDAITDYADQMRAFAQQSSDKPSDELLASSSSLTESMNRLSTVCDL